VGYWSFDGNANDQSGNGNNGAVNGANLTTDRFGNVDSAYSFDGNSSINTNYQGISNQNARSISFWLKQNFSIPSGSEQVLSLYGGSDMGSGFDPIILNNSFPGIDLGASYVAYNFNLLDDWHLYTATYDNKDGANVMAIKIYIDGILMSIVQSQFQGTNTLMTGNSVNLRFGSSFTSGQGFVGKLDDIAIYNRALTQSEITQLYTGTGNGSPLASAQNFCGAAKVANLKAVGTDLKWYDSETATTPLALTAKLMTQTYYVSQTIAGTESPRTAVAVTASPATSAIVVTNGLLLPRVTIGTQTWTKKNLDVATYSDSTPIPQVTDPAKWANLTTGAWCYYDNNPVNGATYGKLYNWYAVAGIYNQASKTDLRLRKKLAPTGYHIASNDEWTTLTDYLGGADAAGGKMKESGTTLWNSPNQDATNSSGFKALPGGYRTNDGTFLNIGYYGYWWSSSEYNTSIAWYRNLYYNLGNASRNLYNKTHGFSVRCLRD